MIILMEKDQEIRRFDFFKGLSEPEIGKITALAKPMSFSNGSMLINEDEIGGEMFLLLEGRIKIAVLMPNAAERQTVAVLRSGEIFGEHVLLGFTRRAASACSFGDTRVLRWDCNELLKHFEANYSVGYRMMTNIAVTLTSRLEDSVMLLRNQPR